MRRVTGDIGNFFPVFWEYFLYIWHYLRQCGYLMLKETSGFAAAVQSYLQVAFLL